MNDPNTQEYMPVPTGKLLICPQCDGTGHLDEVRWVKVDAIVPPQGDPPQSIEMQAEIERLRAANDELRAAADEAQAARLAAVAVLAEVRRDLQAIAHEATGDHSAAGVAGIALAKIDAALESARS